MKKIYSAFISSNFTSLREERNRVINILLDSKILPIGMEHFTVSTSGEFSDLAALIDDSDLFILLMGDYYGSRDENGISWTEREYIYAREKKKQTLVIACSDLVSILSKDASELTEQQSMQVDFYNRIKGFVKKVEDKFTIETILHQFISTFDFSKCIGWTRFEQEAIDEGDWQRKHKSFDIAGKWYHVHLSDVDPTYVRLGEMTVSQEFTHDKYEKVRIDGENYGIKYYNKAIEQFACDRLKKTTFGGNYTLEPGGRLCGRYGAERSFDGGNFQDKAVVRGARYGHHDFRISGDPEEETTFFDGRFSDEAPSTKHGITFIFRSKKERDDFVLEERGDVIEIRS